MRWLSPCLGRVVFSNHSSCALSQMGQMNIIPAANSEAEKKMDPIPGFVAVKEGDAAWETGPVAHCNDCAASFGVATRQHHCRACGKTFCDRCCPKRHLFHDNRACMKCTADAIVSTKQRLLDEHRNARASKKPVSDP